MYQAFFSLKLKPFSISPDPDFLFLSERHKEAIAHLQYGLQGHGGFALLTGEVGTGKTTICRSLVENMGDDTDIAFVLNPALNEIELLATICDDFNIEYQENSLSSIFNALSKWVMNNHLQGRHTIVLIDEAQHLSFAALEQLRLLTDIESHNKKRLQVILIGQTELQEKLKKNEFRQLAQRITARYHLLTLTEEESNFYIQHRLTVAGSVRTIFNRSALRAIYKSCKGGPRLTNILCDRSLLTAYSQHSSTVTREMVLHAANETNSGYNNNHSLSQYWRLAVLILLSVLTILNAPQLLQYIDAKSSFSHQETAPLTQPEAINEEKIKPDWFEEYPELDITKSKYNNALASLYSVWGYQVNSHDVSCEQGRAALLNCYAQKTDIKKLKALNYPSIVRLEKNSDTFLYAVLYKISDDYQLLINGYLVPVTEQWFQQYWNGESTLLWKAPFPLKGVIKFGQEGEQVTWLANQLNKAQGRPSEHKTHFDLQLVDQVSAFQREQELIDDGIVGPRTLMPLMHLASPDSPRLLQETY